MTNQRMMKSKTDGESQETHADSQGRLPGMRRKKKVSRHFLSSASATQSARGQEYRPIISRTLM